jgi:IclR family transcriptional regulator, pca regulon regulatory protein
MTARRTRPATTPGDSAGDSELFVRAFARGLAVIEAMGRGAPRQTLAHIAEAAALPRSVARRFLMTLLELGFAGSDGKSYWLTPKTLRLGLAYVYSQPFWREAQLALEDLRARVEESCSMAVLDGAELVYVVRVPSRRILSMQLAVGSRLPAHVVSLGRVLLAGLDDRALERFLRSELRRLTPRTQHSPEAIRQAIRRVHADGYAWVDGELDEAICGIAVPVRDRDGGVVAAVNVSLQSGQWTEKKAAARFLGPLRQAAARIRSAMLA